MDFWDQIKQSVGQGIKTLADEQLNNIANANGVNLNTGATGVAQTNPVAAAGTTQAPSWMSPGVVIAGVVGAVILFKVLKKGRV